MSSHYNTPPLLGWALFCTDSPVDNIDIPHVFVDSVT